LEQDIFLTFETFLARTAKEDRVFLDGRAFLGTGNHEERERFAAACCGMANGGGGWIVFGAELAENEGRENEEDVFAAEGVPDAALLEREARALLRDEKWISADPVSSFHPILGRASSVRALPVCAPPDEPRTLLAVKVEPAEWFLRPLCAGSGFWCVSRGIGLSSGVVYRRIEGNDVASGLDARFRMARDALERTRDDHPVPGLSVRDLDIESAVSFRRAVLTRHPHWANLSEINFLKRALVLDDDEKVTRAGQLLLGVSPNLSGVSPNLSIKESELAAESGPLRLRRGEEARFASNLWSAYADILPELLGGLTEKCAGAVRECFMNALLHADYDAGRVEIDMDAGEDKNGEQFIRFSNPGLPRARVAGSARNYRLLRMFRLAGVVRGHHEQREKRGKWREKGAGGLDIIRICDENFRLCWDTLELVTRAELRLEKVQAYETAGSEISLGRMPVPEEEGITPEKNSLLGLKRVAVSASNILAAASVGPDVEEEEGGGTGKSATGEEERREKAEDGGDEEHTEDAEEYLDEDEETGFIPEFASLEELVRTTPRLRPSIVRGAILELCEEYKSLPELASALARSEMSLRRHYISAMVREGLLEMEFPDRAGHPAQRYRTVADPEP
jgi:hypothetical protein